MGARSFFFAIALVFFTGYQAFHVTQAEAGLLPFNPVLLPLLKFDPDSIAITLNNDFFAVTHAPAKSIQDRDVSYSYRWIVYPNSETQTEDQEPPRLSTQSIGALNARDARLAPYKFGTLGVEVEVHQSGVPKTKTFTLAPGREHEIPEITLPLQAQFVTDRENTGLEGGSGGFGLIPPPHFKSFQVELVETKKNICVKRTWWNSCAERRIFRESFFLDDEAQEILTAFYILSNNLFASGEYYRYRILDCTFERYEEGIRNVYGDDDYVSELLNFFDLIALYAQDLMDQLWKEEPAQFRIFRRIDNAWWQNRATVWDAPWQAKVLQDIIFLGQWERIRRELDKAQDWIDYWQFNLSLPKPIPVYLSPTHARDKFSAAIAIVNGLANVMLRSNWWDLAAEEQGVSSEIVDDFTQIYTQCFADELNNFGFY